jgi:hypothetical protein
VVLVVGLALFLLTTVGASLYFTSRSTARTRARVLKKQELMKHFNQLRRQLINLYKGNEGACLLGMQGYSEKENELYFLTASMSGQQGVGEVGYRIQKDAEGRGRLEYTEFPFPREKTRRFATLNPQDKWNTISTVIQGLQVEYEQTNRKFDEWKRDDPPDKIRITFWYQEDEGDDQLMPFTFLVVPGIKSVF